MFKKYFKKYVLFLYSLDTNSEIKTQELQEIILFNWYDFARYGNNIPFPRMLSQDLGELYVWVPDTW